MKKKVKKHPICFRLRNVMVGRQIKMADLARAAGKSYKTVWHIMEGKTYCPKFDTVEVLIIALDAAWMPIIEQAEERPANVVKGRFRR